MNEIYVATKLRAEDCDGSSVSILKVGSFDECKNAVRNDWNKVFKHEDIGEFDEEETEQWSCYVEDTICYTLTYDVHKVNVDTLVGV
jgi:hypothetical protein